MKTLVIDLNLDDAQPINLIESRASEEDQRLARLNTSMFSRMKYSRSVTGSVGYREGQNKQICAAPQNEQEHVGHARQQQCALGFVNSAITSNFQLTRVRFKPTGTEPEIGGLSAKVGQVPSKIRTHLDQFF